MDVKKAKDLLGKLANYDIRHFHSNACHNMKKLATKALVFLDECQTCSGSGQRPDFTAPTPKDKPFAFKQIPCDCQPKPEPKEVCDACKGSKKKHISGMYSMIHKYIDCPDCNGTGFKLKLEQPSKKLHPNKKGREDCDGCIFPERHCSECVIGLNAKAKTKSEHKHVWVDRTDGYNGQCGPAICYACGKYGCYCDAKWAEMSASQKKAFESNGIAGNNHALEKSETKPEPSVESNLWFAKDYIEKALNRWDLDDGKYWAREALKEIEQLLKGE